MAGSMVDSTDFKSAGGPGSRSVVGSIPTHSRQNYLSKYKTLWYYNTRGSFLSIILFQIRPLNFQVFQFYHQ